ncbi:NnrU family protein [soil metagenome]
MTLILIGAVIFAGIHLIVMLSPATRQSFEARFGEGPWKGIFSLISAVGLILMIWGLIQARRGDEWADLLYVPADWTRHAAMLLVLIGFILVGASHGKGYFKLWVKQPMSVGIGLWALAHLLTNGERPAVLFFGAFLLIAVLDIILSTMRGKIPQYEPRVRSDVIAIITGIILYAIFLFGFHPYVLGVPIVT